MCEGPVYVLPVQWFGRDELAQLVNAVQNQPGARVYWQKSLPPFAPTGPGITEEGVRRALLRNGWEPAPPSHWFTRLLSNSAYLRNIHRR